MSDRNSQHPPLTDIGSDMECNAEGGKTFAVLLPVPFQNVSGFSEHDEFIQIVINAKTVAQLKNAPEPIQWRGYSTNINPDFQLTKNALKKELLNALLSVDEVSELEQKVFIVM